MIKKLKQFFETQTSLLKKKAGVFNEENVECLIDEKLIDCDRLEAPPFECSSGYLTQGYGFFGYTGVPAPVILNDDPWFGPAPISDVNVDYMERETEIKKQEAAFASEPENIHQLMYEIATKSSATTLQLDPIGGSENFQGGSENVHR